MTWGADTKLRIDRLALVLCLALVAWPFHSIAQEDAPGGAVHMTDDGNRVLYRLRYFDVESVRNLEQLLDQIPDLQMALDDTLRGSDYIVLINTHFAGRAPQDLRDIGRRFKLEDIKRIVILRGPVALERMGVSGPAINIVLQEDADLAVGRWEINAPLVNTGYSVPNMRVSYSDRDRQATRAYELFADYFPNAQYRPRVRQETWLDADNLQPTEQRLTHYDDNTQIYTAGGSIHWALSDRTDIRVATRVSENRRDRLQKRWTDDQQDPDLTDSEDDRRQYELGLSGLVQLSPTRLWDTQLNHMEETRDRLVATGEGDRKNLSPASAIRHKDQRQDFNSAISSMADSGSESGLAIYALRRTRDALSAISLDPVVLASEANIEETSAGLVASYNWQSRRDIRVYGSLDIEHWHFRQQNGPFSRDDRETFVKPVLNLRWKVSPKSQLRFSSRRQVRPLNFDQLVFNYDLEDEIIDTGNFDMVPQKTWVNSLFVERRVLDRKGRISLGVFDRKISDYIDREPRTKGSGPGNIGSGWARGMQLTGRYELLGSSGIYTVFKAELTRQDSEVLDPFTGKHRRLRWVPDRIVKLELRQELLNSSLDYVLDITWRSDIYRHEHNYREIRSRSKPVANLKAHYQATDKLAVWFEARGLFDLDEDINRQRYADDASLGQFSRYENSTFLEDRQFAVGVQGYF